MKPRGRQEKPIMLMLHGAGSSGAILGIQMHSVAKELSKTFDLVFVDAPNTSIPGPGVLPQFTDMPGYYRWLATLETEAPLTARLDELTSVADYIQAQLNSQKLKAEKVEAIFGFSQGALVALAMLGMLQTGQSHWNNLRFCVSVAAGTTGSEVQLTGIEKIITLLSAMSGREDGKFPGYMVNAVATKDLWYADGKRLAGLCAEDKSVYIEYRDGHVVPRQPGDVNMLLKAIKSVNERSKGGNIPVPLPNAEPAAAHVSVLVPTPVRNS